MKRLLRILSMVCAAVGTMVLLRGTDGVLPFSLWILGMLLAAFSLRAGSGIRTTWNRGDALALWAVLLVALALRVYRIEEIPFGIWVDELWNAHNAARLGHLPFRPFGMTPLIAFKPDWVQTTNLYLYFCWLIQRAFSFSHLGVKMISVLPAVLAPPLLYGVCRQYFSFRSSLLAALLFAVSSWHMTLSRWGWDQVLLTTTWIATFLLIERAVRSQSRLTAFAAGVVQGLALYGYLGARLSFLASVAFVAVLVLSHRDRRTLSIAGCFLCGLGLAAYPLLLFWIQHPQVYSARFSGVSMIPWLQGGDFRYFKENLLLYGKVFHWRGDPNARHHFPLDPLLDPLTGLLFVAGLLLALRHFRQRDSQMLLLWFGAAMAGGLLTFEAPHAYRTGAGAPACFLLAAKALDWISGFLDSASQQLRQAAWAALGVCVLAVGGWNAHRYFVVRPADKKCWESTWGNGPAILMVRRLQALQRQGRTVSFDSSLKTFEVESELRLTFGSFGSADPDDYVRKVASGTGRFWTAPETAPSSLRLDPAGALVIKPERKQEYLDRIPDLQFAEIRNPFGTVYALVASRDPTGAKGVR